MNWQLHNNFQSEYKKLAKKHRALDAAFKALQKLLAVQFDPVSPNAVISPGKIHHINTDNSGCELWKVEMITKGLRPNQWPRVWFSVSGATITFLAIASHTSNYDTNTIDDIAKSRLEEIL